MMERILILIRNVVNISSSPGDETRTDDDVCLHDQVVWYILIAFNWLLMSISEDDFQIFSGPLMYQKWQTC